MAQTGSNADGAPVEATWISHRALRDVAQLCRSEEGDDHALGAGNRGNVRRGDDLTTASHTGHPGREVDGPTDDVPMFRDGGAMVRSGSGRRLRFETDNSAARIRHSAGSAAPGSGTGNASINASLIRLTRMVVIADRSPSAKARSVDRREGLSVTVSSGQRGESRQIDEGEGLLDDFRVDDPGTPAFTHRRTLRDATEGDSRVRPPPERSALHQAWDPGESVATVKRSMDGPSWSTRQVAARNGRARLHSANPRVGRHVAGAGNPIVPNGASCIVQLTLQAMPEPVPAG